ncbi:acyl-coenzyme A thioesterase PaaI-like protein [Novosphingobium kunmingense]|uniref:Acyl-coenzyme A thioesterase PaaI-like protein n=1 Tax=Novosphingobium kunmingense TaxID=1211806 RepID=A0A2N0I3A9_9SPHN|nr:PaaI family thioesterase [Novosphingobium kunmingense]PKB25672.1 acyl-coenzyme A thioesterase PaaI-like protein [Novosphingobium kunmingense]
MAIDLAPVMDAEALSAFFAEAFPHGAQDVHAAERFTIAPGFVRIAFDPDEAGLRPGGIVSGPTQMGLADRAAYAVILAHIGPVAMAMTSNLNYSFLRAVAFRRVHADAVLLKLGRRLATVDVRLWQDDPGNVVGQATVTYAIPG